MNQARDDVSCVDMENEQMKVLLIHLGQDVVKQALPSRRMLSEELFLLLTPLDSLDMEVFKAVGDRGKVGEGLRRWGDVRPMILREPTQVVKTK